MKRISEPSLPKNTQNQTRILIFVWILLLTTTFLVPFRTSFPMDSYEREFVQIKYGTNVGWKSELLGVTLKWQSKSEIRMVFFFPCLNYFHESIAGDQDTWGWWGVLFYLPPVEQFCCEYLSSTIIVPFMPDIWKQSTAFGVSHHHLITEKAPQLRAQCCYLSLINVNFCYQQYVKIKPVSGLKHSAKSLKDPYFSTHLSCTHGWLQHRKQNGIHKT